MNYSRKSGFGAGTASIRDIRDTLKLLLTKPLMRYYDTTMTCSVCLHPKLPDIEDALSTGVSVRTAQARFGLSKSAIARHRLNCLGPKVAAAARIVAPSPAKAQVQRARAIVAGEVATPGDVISLTSLLDRLTRSLDRLEGSADAAAVDGLHAALAAVTGQLHKGVETTARLSGLYTDNEQVGRERFSININLPDTKSAGEPQNITPPPSIRAMSTYSEDA